MSGRNLYKLLPLAVLAAALVMGAWVVVAEQVARSKKTSESEEVRKILNERSQVLIEIQRLKQQAYFASEVGFSEVLSAKQAVLSARLELTKMPAERVSVLEGMLKNTQELEKITKKLAQANEAPVTDQLEANAHQLRVEADLIQARSLKQK